MKWWGLPCIPISVTLSIEEMLGFSKNFFKIWFLNDVSQSYEMLTHLSK